jgi:hypothetical protein
MGYLFLYSKRIHYEGDVAHQKLSDLASQQIPPLESKIEEEKFF